MTPEPIKKFAEAFAKLPGIGPRQATRLAFHVFSQGKAEIADLSNSILGLHDLSICQTCFASALGWDICSICSNPNRKKDLIVVVEKETDLISLEKAKKFDGRYLILGELTKDGFLTQAQKMKLRTIQNAEEVVIATNPTVYGDINASVIAQEIRNSAKKITRLGRGIPTGGEIEFADEETLSSAIQNRS